ncbi:MAG: transketolase [Candidatus Omnitrophota bacterium]|nr:MAG: transketolase [Candidatus Omnitrophota bacterium]
MLKKKARWVRTKVLNTIARLRKGHLGGTLSCTDLLVALYYGKIMRFDAANPNWSERDRFLIGKGHAHLALYYIWTDLGFFDVRKLEEYGTDGSSLGFQLDRNIPGSEYNTGSLGHVIGIGAGMALAAKMDRKAYKTIVLVGDGECDEGSIWEAVMFASRYRLNNLMTIVDRNQATVIENRVEDDGSGRLEEKFKMCGWESITINGHSFEQILSAFTGLEKFNRPLAIIADTVKGKGASFLEQGAKWHHLVPSAEEFDRVIREFELEAET